MAEKTLPAKQASSSDSKMPVLCFWHYNFDLVCYITYCLGIISSAAPTVNSLFFNGLPRHC